MHLSNFITLKNGKLTNFEVTGVEISRLGYLISTLVISKLLPQIWTNQFLIELVSINLFHQKNLMSKCWSFLFCLCYTSNILLVLIWWTDKKTFFVGCIAVTHKEKNVFTEYIATFRYFMELYGFRTELNFQTTYINKMLQWWIITIFWVSGQSLIRLWLD